MAFNLRKKAQGFMKSLTQDTLTLPPGINPIAARYLFNNVYKNDPNITTMQDMIDMLDSNGIAWQDNKSDEDVRNDIKLAKKEAKEIKRKRKAKDYAKEYLSQMGRGY